MYKEEKFDHVYMILNGPSVFKMMLSMESAAAPRPPVVNFTLRDELTGKKRLVNAVIEGMHNARFGWRLEGFLVEKSSSPLFKAMYFTEDTRIGRMEVSEKLSDFTFTEAWLLEHSSELQDDGLGIERIYTGTTTAKMRQDHPLIWFWAKANMKRQALSFRGRKVASFVSFKDFISGQKLQADEDDVAEKLSFMYLASNYNGSVNMLVEDDLSQPFLHGIKVDPSLWTWGSPSQREPKESLPEYLDRYSRDLEKYSRELNLDALTATIKNFMPSKKARLDRAFHEAVNNRNSGQSEGFISFEEFNKLKQN
ncbi:hypothetical protein IKF15_04115 [Candidatus Saccharibacteria bacterium]|nr:hypothetical protein [Candidatus Saccharibacteria bacterium]